MIRKIKRNISEAATGQRLNRYGNKRVLSFKSQREVISSFINSLFKMSEYLKHRVNRLPLIRAHNREVSETGVGNFILP